jgi:hypothetical protein
VKKEQKEDVEMHKAQLEPEEEVPLHRRKPFRNLFEGQHELDVFT